MNCLVDPDFKKVTILDWLKLTNRKPLPINGDNLLSIEESSSMLFRGYYHLTDKGIDGVYINCRGNSSIKMVNVKKFDDDYWGVEMVFRWMPTIRWECDGFDSLIYLLDNINQK